MKILDVAIRNFGSFHGQHRPFRIADRGLVLILGENHDEPRADSNGSGKSMLLDAVDWCFFGETPRNDTAASVVNEKAGKDCEVSITVEADDGHRITVVRSRGVPKVKNGVRFFVDDEDRTTQDSAETQARLERALGLNRDVFHAAVLFAQFDEWRFADASDAERKTLLTKIIPELSTIDGWLDRTKELLTEADRAVDIVAGEIASLESKRRYHAENDPRPMSQQWEQQVSHRHNEAQQRVWTLRDAAQQAHAELQTLGEKVPVPDLPGVPPVLDHAQRALSGAAAAHRRATDHRVELEAQLRTLEAQRRKLVEGDRCPTCGQALPQNQDPAIVTAQIAELQDRLEAVRADEAHLESSERAALEEANRHQQAHSDAVAAHNQQVAAAHAHNQQVDRATWNWTSLNQQYGEAMKALEAVSAETNPFHERITQWEGAGQQIEVELQEAHRRQEAASTRNKHLRFWKEAFGPKGVKSHLLDTKLAAMSEEANRWLRILFGGTVWVRFETQTRTGTGKKGKLVDKFNIRVFRHNPDGTQTERNYRSWCGGEKHRISTGIDFGLARLVASRASQTWDVLFLDEIFGKHLDRSGKEAVAEMLRELMKEKSSIFVVDHDPRFQGMFEEIVVVEKRNGESHIKEAP